MQANKHSNFALNAIARLLIEAIISKGAFTDRGGNATRGTRLFFVPCFFSVYQPCETPVRLLVVVIVVTMLRITNS